MLTSEKEKDDVNQNEGYLENNEEVQKQQPSDESNEMHFAEECGCGKDGEFEM